MEDKGIREKLLCALRGNADLLEYKQEFHGDLGFLIGFYYKLRNPQILLYTESVYNNIKKTKVVNVKPKFFWGKLKQQEVEYTTLEKVGYKGVIEYGNEKFRITKEEYDEIVELREEKIKEVQLEELTKLCNGSN